MSTLKTTLICIILIFRTLQTDCQNRQDSILADYLYSNGNIDLALKENLKSYLFSNHQSDKYLPLKVANLFFEVNDYQNAIKYLDIQYNSLGLDDPKREEIRYQKIKIYITTNQFKSAEIEILQLNERSVSDLNKYYFYKGMIYYLNDEYVNGLNVLNRLNYLDVESYKKLNTICKLLIINLKKKTDAYQIASGIIPGLGQYFSGDIPSGLNSTILNGGLLYLFFSVGERLSYGDAFLSVGPWLSRYFIGGVGNAKTAALTKKNKKKAKLIKETLNIISTAQHSNQ